MGIWARVFGKASIRERGVLATAEAPQDQETPRLRRPTPTRGTIQPVRPEPTPTTRPIQDFGPTAATPSYRQPGGTPSTQRLHNPRRPGR